MILSLIFRALADRGRKREKAELDAQLAAAVLRIPRAADGLTDGDNDLLKVVEWAVNGAGQHIEGVIDADVGSGGR